MSLANAINTYLRLQVRVVCVEGDGEIFNLIFTLIEFVIPNLSDQF